MTLDQTVLITGAAGNLGRALAEVLARAGARLVLVDREQDALQRAFGSADARRCLVSVDLLDAGQARDAVQAGLAAFGRIDGLCNLAGGFTMGETVHEAAPQTWERMHDLNLQTLLNMCRATVPSMIEAGSGSIVNIAANSARQGLAGMGPYCLAKSGVIRLTETMSAELRDRGVRVNCMMPGVIDTPENRASMPDADPAHWVAPAALADVIAFLLSDGARAIHGAAIPVTGLS